jgi:outer membrane protein TolC
MVLLDCNRGAFAWSMLMAAVLSCSGCAAVIEPRPTVAPPAQDVAPGLWWSGVSDPVLTRLIEQGFSDREALTCRALALKAADARILSVAPPVRGGLFARRARRASPGFAYDEVRSRLALAIGSAYLDARLARDRLALREAALAALRDNREIAGFRREAGLVSGLDLGLSGLIVALDDSSIETARADLARAIARLATVSGLDAAQLQDTILGEDRLALFDAGEAVAPETALAHRADLLALRQSLFDSGAARKIAPAALDGDDPGPGPAPGPAIAAYRAAVARARDAVIAAGAARDAARARATAQDQVLAGTARTVADARLDFRLGKQGMATLYVAEAAALAARESVAQATAAFDQAVIALWTAQGRGWSVHDVAPPAAQKSGLACD